MEKQSKLLEMILKAFFKHQLQIKMFHFQTKKYGAHKTSDKYLDKFEKNLDKFMEVAQGVFGKFNIQNISLNFQTVSDLNINQELDEFIKLCKSFDSHYKDYSELMNIRDEITANAEQFKYLLTFK